MPQPATSLPTDPHVVELRRDLEDHKAEQERRWDELRGIVQRNSESTERLAASVEQIAQNTQGVVQLYQDFRGAARIGVGFQKLMRWTAGLGTAGVAIAAGLTYIAEKLGYL